MQISNSMRKNIFIGVALLIFSVWFADGYLQLVNSDTSAEASGVSQTVAFPQGLISELQPFHSRIFGTILSNVPFNTVGVLYRELKNDPVNALYVSQGVMTGTVFMLFVLISAAYVSTTAPLLSARYLVSAIMLLLLTMSLPVLPLSVPLSLTLRFGHQAVMTNYVGTMTIALFALFPFWRYIFSGNWDDWYCNGKWRSLFYIFIIAAAFSSTATMIWLGTFALTALLSMTYYLARECKEQRKISYTINCMLKSSKSLSLFIIIGVCIVGVIAESTTDRGGSVLSNLNLFKYVSAYFEFIITSKITWYFCTACILIFTVLSIEYKKGDLSSQLVILVKMFPWLVFGNLIFIFIIGIPRVSYRFYGYNLGTDTALPATWTMVLWFIAVIICFWRVNKLIWMAPLLMCTLATNSLSYFVFDGYEAREKQKKIFSTLTRENTNLPMNVTLQIPVTNIAFSPGQVEAHAVPMLRRIGIISAQRKVQVVPDAVYESYHTDIVNNSASAVLQNK